MAKTAARILQVVDRRRRAKGKAARSIPGGYHAAGMRFRLFGPDHLAALALAAAAALALCRRARRDPGEHSTRGIRAGLAAGLLLAAAAFLAHLWRRGGLSVWDVLPLHLCDFLVLLAAYALLTLRPAACEVLYFWSAGTLLAMITPDLAVGFPHPYFLSYFALHGAVVAAAVVVTFGCGRRPRAGAPWRAFLALLGYAAAVGAVDFAFDENFLYLRRPPAERTLLDWFGPWPVYLVTVAAFALGLFVLMDRPFRRGAG